MPVPLGDDEELSYLSGNWRIAQKKNGHRWSLDDLVTADFAASSGPAPTQHLDLGCGIGSVLLLIAWRFPQARSVGVEAQPESASLARRSVTFNGADRRVEVRDGDLRTAWLPEAELITGTPPYFPVGTGTAPSHPQSNAALFELRGGPEAYAAAAARALAPNGRFVLCASVKQEERVFAALAAQRLFVSSWQRVIPAEGKAPLLTLWSANRRSAAVPEPLAPLTVRDRSGQWTADFLQLRLRMGLPPRP